MITTDSAIEILSNVKFTDIEVISMEMIIDPVSFSPFLKVVFSSKEVFRAVINFNMEIIKE